MVLLTIQVPMYYNIIKYDNNQKYYSSINNAAMLLILLYHLYKIKIN